MLNNNLNKEEIQKFIKKHHLAEAFEVDNMLFRVKGNAEGHCRLNKIDADKIVTHAKEVAADDKAKVKKAEENK